MIIILIGLPGSGKGTQARYISSALNLPHISTGEILRRSIDEKTSLGLQAKAYVDSGKLVPDEIIVAMSNDLINSPSNQEGLILDGYPRTVHQATNLVETLEKNSRKIDLVLYLKVAPDLLKERISGRRISLSSGKEYHIKYNPPKVDGYCDIDGSKLVQREDDKYDKILKRLNVYQQQTEPVISYFRNLGLIYEVDASKLPNLVQQDIDKLIKNKLEQ